MASIKLILIVHESAPVLGIFRWSSPIKSKSKVLKNLKKNHDQNKNNFDE